MAGAQRVEIGFEGGQVISTRLADEELNGLRAAVSAANGWHELSTEEGLIHINLSKLIFLRIGSGEHRVGFALGE